ncbi:MAG: MFS transporter [Casimicrobiaceae bacterium]
MSGAGPSGGAAEQPQRSALVALVATLAIQMYTSLATTAPAVLAPSLAADLGITPTWIGVFVSIIYGGAMLGSLSCPGFIARYGAIRVSQACVLLCAVGIALVGVLPGAAVRALAGAAFIMGLGYGPITPASSDVLIRTTPSHRMGLTFSIKQTGVPAGAALAGAILPALALLAGWRGSFALIAVAGLFVIAASQPTRRALDVHRRPGPSFSLGAIVTPLKVLVRTPKLLELSLAGFAFAGVQTCLSSFLVVYLKESLQWSLVSAGLALTCASFSAVVGRIAWGLVADRSLPANRVLAIIGMLAALCGVALAFAAPEWPTWVMLLLAALYGATAIGWNGVQLAELARRAPAGTAGAVTGASGFISFGGVFVGPLLFAALTGVSDSYRAGFLVCAAVSAIAGATLLHRGRQAAQ